MTEKLTKVLDLLVAEEREAAALALNEWFTEQHQSIVSQLTEEDEELDESVTITIDDDANVDTGSVQPVAEAGGSTVNVAFIDPNDGDDRLISFASEEDANIYMAFENAMTDMSAYSDYGLETVRRVDDVADNIVPAGALSEFANIFDEEVDDDEIQAAYSNVINIVSKYDQPYSGEDDDMDESVDVESDETEVEVDVEDEPLTARVDDLEAELEAIRAQFAELMGDEADDEEVEVDVEDEEEVEEDIMPEVPGTRTPFSQQSGIDGEGYKDIHEAVELDTVKEPIEGDKEIGNGPKVKIEKHSPVPNVKPEDRVGGTPVVVKGPEYKGYAMQTPPPVKDSGIKGKVRNAKHDLKDVPADGDKSAILNKEKSTNDLSPISGQEELRGSDIKRKK